MISHTYRCIFVHAGRTGGSSIERLLGAGITTDERSSASGNTDFPEKHCDFQYYQSTYPDEFGDYFKFTIVRNPFDRLVSAWLWQKEVVKITRIDSFRKFIEARPEAWKYSEKFRLAGCTSMDSIRYFDYIGRFEKIVETYDFLCRRLHLGNVPVPHTNRTTDRRYQDFYTPETVRLVEEKFSLDLQLFGYHYENA